MAPEAHCGSNTTMWVPAMNEPTECTRIDWNFNSHAFLHIKLETHDGDRKGFLKNSTFKDITHVMKHLSPWHLRRTLQSVNYHPSELHTWKTPHSHKHLFQPGWRIPPQSTSPKQELLCPSALPALYLCLSLHLTVELMWSSNTACLVSPEKFLLLWVVEDSQHLEHHVAIVLKQKENLCRAWWRLNRRLCWPTHHLIYIYTNKCRRSSCIMKGSTGKSEDPHNLSWLSNMAPPMCEQCRGSCNILPAA